MKHIKDMMNESILDKILYDPIVEIDRKNFIKLLEFLSS